MYHNHLEDRFRRHGSRHVAGRCVVCSQLITLSTACKSGSSPTVTDDTRRKWDQSPGADDELDGTDISRSSSLLSARSNSATSVSSRGRDSDDLSASSSSSTEGRTVVESSRQSSVLSAADRRSVDSVSTKDGDDVHRGSTAAADTNDSRRRSSQCSVDDAADATSTSSSSDVGQGSSSEASLLSAKESSPDHRRWNPTTNARQPDAISCDEISRRCSQPDAVAEQLTLNDDARAYQRFDGNNSADDKRQESHQGDVETEADSSSHVDMDSRQVSSNKVSLHGAKGSSPNNNGRCLTIHASQSNVIDSGRVIVLHLEDWIEMWKYLRCEQLQSHDAHPEVTRSQSTERRASAVNSRNSSNPISCVSSAEFISSSVQKRSNEKNGNLCAEKKSKRAEKKLLRNGDFADCCGGQRRLCCHHDIAPRDCFSQDNDTKSKNENKARGSRKITFETPSTPSDREVGCSRSERSVAYDDGVSRSASAAPGDCGRQKSVPDECRREFSAENWQGVRRVPDEKAVCPNCHRDDCGQKTNDEVSSDSESTDESELSSDHDEQDEEQLSSTDVDGDSACLCNETVVKDSEVSSSWRSDATSRRGSLTTSKKEASSNAGRRQYAVVDKTAAVSKLDGDVHDARRCRELTTTEDRCCDYRDSRRCVELSCAGSRTTEMSSVSYSCSSCSDNESECTRVDDDDDDDDDTCPAVTGRCEVSGFSSRRCSTTVERRSSAGVLSLSCVRPVADR